VLELHKGTYFFGSEDLGAKLFIRDFWYDAVENRLKEHFSSGGKAMAIIGNPGDVRQHYLSHFSSSGCIRSSYANHFAINVQVSVRVCWATYCFGDGLVKANV
jgi:hypothetical protein